MKKDYPYLIVMIISLIGLAIVLSGCNRWGIDNYTTSTVKKGKHDFTFDPHKRWISGRGIRVHVRFTESCRYDLGDPDQWDFNKAPGLMTTVHPHTISARVGWRYIDGMIQLTPYVHATDKTVTHFGGRCADKINIGKWTYYEIADNGTEWLYRFKNGYKWSKAKRTTDKINKVSGFWFGGNRAAPHDMAIDWWIEKIEA